MRSLIIEFMYLRFDKDEDEDVYLENLILGLPFKLQRAVKRHICLDGFMGWGFGNIFIWVKQCRVNS